jgi:hypothetical protein
MKLIEMTVADGYAQLLFADHPNKDSASEWIEFKVRMNGGGNNQITEMQSILAAFDEQMERIRREAAPPERLDSGPDTLRD